MSHNLTVETLREGVYYNVNVRAVNKVGPSEIFQTGFTVNNYMSSEELYKIEICSFKMYINLYSYKFNFSACFIPFSQIYTYNVCTYVYV